MMNATMRVPPSGHKYVTMQQVLSADRELWSMMSQESRGNLKVSAGAEPPLDKLIVKLRESPQVLCFMTPLPGSTVAQVPKPQPAAPKQVPQGPKRPASDTTGPRPFPKNKQRRTTEQGGKTVKDLLSSMPPNCVSKTAGSSFACTSTTALAADRRAHRATWGFTFATIKDAIKRGPTSSAATDQ